MTKAEKLQKEKWSAAGKLAWQTRKKNMRANALLLKKNSISVKSVKSK